MKKHKNTLHAGSIWFKLTAIFVIALSVLFVSPVTIRADHDVRPRKIYAVGKKSIAVYTGEEFELKVKMASRYADDDALKWKIVSGSEYVRFTDDDRNDDEIELKAIKVGTAKIRCKIKGTLQEVNFTVRVKKSPQKIRPSGRTKRTVEVGDDFELEVKKFSGLKERYLTWSIDDMSIVHFDDDDCTGDDMEFRAIKPGTAKITCTNTVVNQKVTFTVTVVNDNEDDD